MFVAGVREAAEAAEMLRDGVDALLASRLDDLEGPEIADLLVRVEAQRRRLAGVDARLIAAAERRRQVGEFAAATVVDLLSGRLRIDPREAARRDARAQEIGPRRTLTGEPLPPLLPATAAAVAAGAIDAAHADVIARYVDKVDALPDLAPDALGIVEDLLVTAARHECPRQVARLAERLLARLDPDGTEPADRRLDSERNFTLCPRPDGSASVRGILTPELTAACQALLDALAAPVPDPDGAPDPRSAAQRRHDALLDAFGRLLRGDLAPAGGTPLTVLVRFSADQLPAGLTNPPSTPDAAPCFPNSTASDGHALRGGFGQTARGGLIFLSRLGCGLCEAEMATTAVNDRGGVLAFGRTRRLASKAQRLALAARDGGCSFPGCTRPAAWTEAHHVVPWWAGGRTDLDNLCLLCPYHHRHFARLGWQVTMTGGAPHWVPPPWIDPRQQPRRNTAAHLAEYDFGEVARRCLSPVRRR